MPLRCTLRDLLWLTLVVALALSDPMLLIDVVPAAGKLK